jgi:hypothetical protein
MLQRTLLRRGGGDKSSFAAKRMVIHPMMASPSAPGHMVPMAFTLDALKISKEIKFGTGGAAMKDALDLPDRLEGERSRREVMQGGDPEFDALVDFVRGARFDDMITGRRFQKAYDALTEKDEVITWLCMTAMAILNPGDVRSRLIYRHLEALVQAVASGEMTPRVAFRFYESAIRSPAYREIAARQLETGASTRVAGLCAAADTMRAMGVSRRPMTSYFELFHRITERSEAMTPWGFPPLFQFEERTQLEQRLRPFGRSEPSRMRRKRRPPMPMSRYAPHRIFWVAPSWKTTRKYVGTNYAGFNRGFIPD